MTAKACASPLAQRRTKLVNCLKWHIIWYNVHALTKKKDFSQEERECPRGTDFVRHFVIFVIRLVTRFTIRMIVIPLVTRFTNGNS